MDWARKSTVGVACELITGWTGLELEGTAPRRVEEFLGLRSRQLGFDSKKAYLEHLDTLDRADPEPQRLVNLVTNGLTLFWRDEPQLDAYNSVISKLYEQIADKRPLQVWCAGCSTGEEAYTVAMLAEEAGVEVEVLGTDINTEYLRHARDGVYGPWSLRRMTKSRQDRFFEEAHHDHWRVDRDVRHRVTFRHHNILSRPLPPLTGDDWDVVMCRNVLIYFAPKPFAEVLEHFAEALHSDGYLLLGSTEQLHTDHRTPEQTPFRSAQQGGGFVYRLASTPPGRTVAFGSSLPKLLEESASDDAPPAIPLSKGGLEEVTTEVGQSEVVDHLLDRAREHFTAGHEEAAIAACEAAASYDPFVTENYTFMGYILARAGAYPQALDTYRKALFLDPYNWVAAIESGRLYVDEGDVTRARRVLRQALEGIEERRRLPGRIQSICQSMPGVVTAPSEAAKVANQWLERLDK